MKREGNVIQFEDAEKDLIADFELGMAGGSGLDVMAAAMLRACNRAGLQQRKAWRRIRDRFIAAGLASEGDEIVYHWEREEFSVRPTWPKRGSPRDIDDLLVHMGEAKVEAVKEKNFTLAASLRDASEQIVKTLADQAKISAGAETDTASPTDGTDTGTAADKG